MTSIVAEEASDYVRHLAANKRLTSSDEAPRVDDLLAVAETLLFDDDRWKKILIFEIFYFGKVMKFQSFF